MLIIFCNFPLDKTFQSIRYRGLYFKRIMNLLKNGNDNMIKITTLEPKKALYRKNIHKVIKITALKPEKSV